MAHFRISFDADPENSTAPWGHRESSRLKMMQSLTDYLTERCCASNVTIVEVIDKPPVEEPAAPVAVKKTRRSRL
jgi:hypothetical protein